MPNCGNCADWRPVAANSSNGACRGERPKAFFTGFNEVGQALFTAVFPPMSSKEWCACHRPKGGSPLTPVAALVVDG